MTKTLTIHNKSRGGEHWFLANAYGKEEIKAIKDPEGGNTKKLPTSIPSPFSQFDLVKTAFRNVVEEGFDKCSPLDFRIVSHTLDVGQLFFNLKAFENNLSITAWDSKEDLQNLLNGSKNDNKKHRRFGEVLKLFLDQDAETYNFDKLNKLFILKFNHGIVGGTSPATVFFASPNNLDFAQLTMPNNDILFDDSYCHLYDRDEDYQLFWFALQKAMPEFGSRFREVNDYLEMVKEHWSKDREGFYKTIKNLDFDTYTNNYEIGNSGVGGHNLEILGFPLRISKEGSDTNKESDFEINSTKYYAEKMPLVLIPNHSGRNRRGQPMNYWGGNLSDNIAKMIPYKYEDATAVTERRLPGVSGANYPCLLSDDFLEPYLIRLVYPINEKCFFDGKLSNRKEEKDYLIPIKKEFFEYFNIEDLQTRSMPDGSPMFSMRAIIGDSVEVTLRIPIKNNEYITFQRVYYDGIEPEPFENKGGIVEHEFGLNIFPFVKHDVAIQADYRVMLLDRDISSLTSRYHLTFLNKDSQKVEYKTERHKRKKTVSLSGSHFYILKEQFDVIELSINDSNVLEPNKRKGLIIPLFSEKASNKKFRFAIDFGTTNTHIEYTVDSSVPKPFEITENDTQIATLHNLAFAKKDPSLNGTGATDVISFIDKEFVPVIIEKGKMASFPQRTILAESHDISYGSDTYVIGDFNIPFPYEKEPINEYKISANLKWQNYQMDEKAKRRVEAFFEKLLFMIKAKVLLNQGRLKDTEIIWTYPSSMTSGRLENLRELWEKTIKKYIGVDNQSKISESIAPYYYYKTKNIYAGTKPALNIDIGGGTTDVVVYVNDKPQLLTSFKFAANSLYGDGFGQGGADNNGFINRYGNKVKSLLAENNLFNLIRVFNELEQNKNSVDLAAFFFSLEENHEILERGLPISYHRMLKGDDAMRFVFLVFYAAILYHIAKLTKKRGIAMPRYITLSGKGSKALGILGSLRRVEKLSEVIIKKIYDEKDENGRMKYAEDGLSIITENLTSKEVTCKGALGIDKAQLIVMDDIDFLKSIKSVWSGAKEGEVDEPEVYNDINENVKNAVKAEIEDFIDFLFALHRDFNFQDELNISVSKLSDYKDLLKKDIGNHIEQGLSIRRQELQGDFERPLEETLFFYHFIPALNKLATAIHQQNP